MTATALPPGWLTRRGFARSAAAVLGAAACGELPVTIAGAAPEVLASDPDKAVFIPVDALRAGVATGNASIDTAAIQEAFDLAALAPTRSVIGFMQPRRYLWNTTAVFTGLVGVTVTTPFPGIATIRATDSNTAQWLMQFEYSSGMLWDGVCMDARGATRTISGGGVACGLRLYRSHGATVRRSGFRRMLGIASPQQTANACAAVECDDLTVSRSWVVDAPTTDGFYVSGNDALIQDVTGIAWGDTLAVIENGSRGRIRRVRGRNGGALVAVSNFSNANHTGNTVEDCQGTSLVAGSGGYRLQTTGAAGGKLTFTTFRRCTVTGMTGPGMWLYKEASSGALEDVTIDTLGVVNPTTQGLLVQAGTRVTATQVTVIGPGSNGVHVETPASSVDVTMAVTTAQSTGAAVVGATGVTYRGVVTGTAGVTVYGAYAYGTCPTLSHDLAGTDLFALVGADPGSTWVDLTP